MQGSSREGYFENHIAQNKVRLAEVEGLLNNQSTLISKISAGVALAEKAASGLAHTPGDFLFATMNITSLPLETLFI